MNASTPSVPSSPAPASQEQDRETAQTAAPAVVPHWFQPAWQGEGDQLLLTYLLTLAAANAGFALASWQVHYIEGSVLHGLGLLISLGLCGIRWRGLGTLDGVTRAAQGTLLVQAMALAWTSGGIFSPMVSWLAWASLPSLMNRSVRQGLVWIAGTALLVVGLYLYALLGGDVVLGVPPTELVHWHLMVVLLTLAMQWGLLHRFHRIRQKRMDRMRDHTRQLERARAELVLAQKQKDIFVASVSHELRTPMNAITGLADLIQHDQRLPDDIRTKVENIQKSSEHLLTIINDLLDYSQIEAGALRIIEEPFPLHQTLQTAYSILAPRAETKPIAYTLMIGHEVPAWIMGDSHRLTQALVNLLGNAVKFTSQGEVSLRCRFEASLEDASRGVLHLEVHDTGIGIALEDQHKLFGQFVQADQSISRRFGGSGLGLSITRNLIEAMGGAIRLHSRLGVGSRFSIELPCRVAAASEPGLDTDDVPQQLSPIRILVVDDNALNRQVASLQLRRQLLHAEVEQAANGEQALEKVRDGSLDIVLLDLLMPGMDGFATARKIRQELPPPLCNIPIIALTADSNPEQLQRCLNVGMNATLIKPFDRVELARKVMEHALRKT